MPRMILACILFASALASAAFGTDEFPGAYEDTPNKNTPRKLQEAWLRFHETDLCQEVDAVFIFDESKMEIWNRIEGDKGRLKFQRLFGAFGSAYRVNIYTTYITTQKKMEDRLHPPPSLWQNSELRASLGDRNTDPAVFLEEQDEIFDPRTRFNSILKQRLVIYAEQTLQWNSRIERYALDLVALTRTAFDPAIVPEVKSKAIQACLAHAKSLEKYIGKLEVSLSQAIPGAKDARRSPLEPATAGKADQSLEERAEQICSDAKAVTRRVFHFIYPEDYTVELDELRAPSLLESLATLRRTVADFQQRLLSARK